MNNKYNLTLSLKQGQTTVQLGNHSYLNRKWFGQFALHLFTKASNLTTEKISHNQLTLNKEQLQRLFIEITTIYQWGLIQFNIEKDLSKLSIPKYLMNICQSLLLMMRMNSSHQNYMHLQNYYIEEYRTLNCEALNQSLEFLVNNKLIQKIETEDHQTFFDKNPQPHNHIYFKKQQRLIDCNDECFDILSLANKAKFNLDLRNNKSRLIFEINY